MKYGKLELIGNVRHKGDKFLFRCDCGTEKLINIYNVKSGTTYSCGCLKKEKMREEAKKRFTGQVPACFTDYTGKVIGMITVLRRVEDRRPNTTTYQCQCECGTQFETEISTLRRCKYDICDHIYPRHPLRKVLTGMMQRCENRNAPSYKYYGEKGIKVFEQWKILPHTFIDWAIKNGWKEGLQIDRIISSDDYNPENCRFISKTENSKRAMRKRWKKSENYIEEAKEYLEFHGFTITK